MPIYEYQCKKCEHIFEELQRFSDPAPERCPSCGAKGEVSRLVSRSSFHLQGGGWYSDDYSSTSSSVGRDTAAGTTEESTSSGESSASDSKSSSTTSTAAAE